MTRGLKAAYERGRKVDVPTKLRKEAKLCPCGCGEYLLNRIVCTRAWMKAPDEVKHVINNSLPGSPERRAAVRALLRHVLDNNVERQRLLEQEEHA